MRQRREMDSIDSAGSPVASPAVAFEFPVGQTPAKMPRRIRRRLLESGRSSTAPSSVEEIEAKLKESDQRRQAISSSLIRSRRFLHPHRLLLPPPLLPTTPSSSPPPSAMEGAKKRSHAPDPQTPPKRVKNEIHDLPAIFDPESSEWKMMSPLLPVLKDVFEEPGKAPGEHEYLSDWIAVSECARCLIKFLSRCDLIEECDKLPSRIDRLKEACQGSSFDYTALIRYAEGIYADAADLRGKGYNALKDNEEETVEDLRGQFADLTLIKYRRQLKELTVQRAQEQGAQFATTLERSISQVDELKRRIGLAEQLQQELLAVLDVRRREEADAVKKKKETQGKFSDIPLYAYQEQRRQVLSRAKMVSFMEPGPTPLSLARDSD